MIESGLHIIRSIVEIAGIPAAIYIGKLALDAYGKNHATSVYGRAIFRAVGAGNMAAQRSGETLLTERGRQIAVEAGAKYLMSTVADQAALIGITSEFDHAKRVAAQIGLIDARVQAASDPASTNGSATVILTRPDGQEPPAPAPAILRPGVDGSD